MFCPNWQMRCWDYWKQEILTNSFVLFCLFAVVAERDALAISKSPYIVHLFYSFQSRDRIFLVSCLFLFPLEQAGALISLEACNQKEKKCPKTQTKDNYIVCFCTTVVYAQIINSSVLAFLAKFGCPDAHQNCSLFATARDCETGLLKLVHHIV